MIQRGIVFFLILINSNLFSQTLLENVNVHKRDISYMQSSYDRTGYNRDFFQYARFGGQAGNSNFIEVIKSGKVNNPTGNTNGKNEYVICKIEGPAVLERIWMISLFVGVYNTKLRFYFDGESVPRITTTDKQLFSGSYSYFIPPLVHNFQSSSGGSISYLRMNIKESLIVTIDSARIFYQFGFRKLSPDTILTSWNGAPDTGFIFNEFRRSGNYPKDNFSRLVKDTVRVESLLPGQKNTLYSTNGPGIIDGIQLLIPQINTSNAYPISDSGRYHKGKSKFTLRIDPDATSYELTKRMSKINLYGAYKAENAIVKVDGVIAGSWSNTNYRDHHFWEDVRFVLPDSLCIGKSQIKIEFIYSGFDAWNEFFYWIKCDSTITDSLDVGSILSETAHEYSVTLQEENPFSLNYHEARYKTPEYIRVKNSSILDSLYINIVFDDTVRSVYCPVGLFFGTGTNDAASMRSLPVGMQNDIYYNYFSMPFWGNATVSIENRSSQQISNVSAYIFSDNKAPNKRDVTGYFYSQYNNEKLFETDTLQDYKVAEIQGKGLLVGHIIEARHFGDTSVYVWLEGDERVFIDDAKSPIIHGTGTEDIFNATFYFVLDEFSLPQHGMTNSDTLFHRSMYRFYLTDPIYFSKNILFKLEHGDYNNRPAIYHSLTFFYLLPNDTSLQLTDSILITNTASEVAHDYVVLANSFPFEKYSSYEGDHFRDTTKLRGRKLDIGSEFSININPDNNGIRLMRTLFFEEKNQKARIWVDSVFVGYWSTPGNNPFISWKDDFFYIPKQFTQGKSGVRIKVLNDNLDTYWTEIKYKVYNYLEPSVNTTVSQETPKRNISIFPNPTSGKVFFNINDVIKNELHILLYNMNGNKILEINLNETDELDMTNYPSGTYLLLLKDRKQQTIWHEEIIVRQ